jgi:hypothetical protein
VIKSSKKIAILVATVGFVIAGQAAAQHGLGSTPGKDAPQLIMRDGVRVWNNPGAFGPVPKDQYDRGVKVCSAMNTREASFVPIGYHPKAMDNQGVEYQGGGFFCVQAK